MTATYAGAFHNISKFCICRNASNPCNSRYDATVAILHLFSYKRTFSLIFMICIAISGVTLNGIGVIDFSRSRVPNTPLNFNIVHLFSLNIVLLLTQQAMNAINVFHPEHAPWMSGNRICDLYMFCSIILNVLIMNFHRLLALTRTWTIMHPLSYCSHNTSALPLQLLTGMWIYVLLVTLPLRLMDVFTYRKPMQTYGCIFNSAAQLAYKTVIVLVISTLPVVVVWMASSL
ncbi:hypothetical protein BV898_16374 [Hypsibius exemplaris]|uniref:G-protein coupled receptors family 1 profile domain-containing protein n=1 Tax=Hypsibius exemplaris TaxID=2072580 RepID=A0A9X6NEP4_HYPEX|nr:hypothetical protein BV898_16374 [Hypsibius exemplaris]